MTNIEHEPIMGIWGLSPKRSRAEPLVMVREQSPLSPEAESILSFISANEVEICPFFSSCKLLKYVERILLHFCLA